MGSPMKLNVDGAVNPCTGMARVGCVARGADGQWLVGEARSLGFVSPLEAELLAIYYGLKMLWRRSFKPVLLESDSREAIKLVLGESEGRGHVINLVQSCRELLAKPRSVQIIHVFREVNLAADKLAKWAARRGLRVFELGRPLQELLNTLEEDARGIEPPRTGGGSIFC